MKRIVVWLVLRQHYIGAWLIAKDIVEYAKEHNRPIDILQTISWI